MTQPDKSRSGPPYDARGGRVPREWVDAQRRNKRLEWAFRVVVGAGIAGGVILAAFGVHDHSGWLGAAGGAVWGVFFRASLR